MTDSRNGQPADSSIGSDGMGNHKRHWSCWLRSLLLVCAAGSACAALAQADPAAALREKYASLASQLQLNQFKRPLVLDSTETPKRLQGDIYAVVDYPFGAVSTGLNNPGHWCDVLLLHINTKYCHALEQTSGTILRVYVGKKTPEELADGVRVEFNFKVAVLNPDYFKIVLNAKDGPLGTSDYLILLDAVALPNSKTFLHLTYSYAINFAGRLAMQAYLATIGRGKLGFTVIGKRDGGQPNYVGGVRGLVERNTMRYYLAVDSFLGAANAPPQLQLEQRLQNWFTAVEQYPRQLHEMERGEYLEMKRAEHLRQQAAH